MGATAVRGFELDLDAFEGPFDLLCTLVLKEELELAEVELATLVLSFVERLEPNDLEACGEFLVLVSSLLELKGRELFPDEDGELEELDPEDAAQELAERLAAFRRFRAAAEWLERRLEEEGDRYFRLGPAPLAPVPERPQPAGDPAALGAAMRALAADPPEPSLRHLALTFPPVALFLERFRAVLRRRKRFLFDQEVDNLSRVELAVAFLALLELRKGGEVRLGQTAPLEPITVWTNAA
jgi:segregation and condensation protein A